ncbi:hypothetical protein [Bacillus sp. EB01]|uniref:hypothetical protein n=1 Tax=Bacillus sp. EB01 TaxID=1347086 RepID=UPI0005C79BC1|nr:hypothetical protein [Bacillus sp. EB01]
MQLNNQSIAQTELIQSILNLLQQHQLHSEETRNTLSTKLSEEQAALKSDLELQKKQQIKLGVLLGTVQIVLSISILATVLL